MIYKKIPLRNISDYLTYIKNHYSGNFQFDILINNIVFIQVLGHQLKSDTPELQVNNDYVILAYFPDIIREKDKAEMRLRSTTKYNFAIIPGEEKYANYYIRISKNVFQLHSLLKFLIEEVYQLNGRELYSVNFYKIESKLKIELVNYIKLNRIKTFLGL